MWGWAKKVGSWFATTVAPDIATGLVTAFAVEKHLHEEKGEEEERGNVGHKIGKALYHHLTYDRDAFLHELRMLNAKTKGKMQPILDLFYALPLQGNVVRINGQRYPEVWIGKKLLSIDPRYRPGLYLWFAADLATSLKRFIADLEALNDTGWKQYAQVVKSFLEGSLPTAEQMRNFRQSQTWIRRRRNR